MPTIRHVLPDTLRKEFEAPPVFDLKQRRFFFTPPEWALGLLKDFTSPTNQVAFLLQLGYFRASGRFFLEETFRKVDVEHLCNRLKLDWKEVDVKDYPRSSRHRHQKLILKSLGVLPFRDEVRTFCQQEADHLVTRQLKLHLVFGALTDFIRQHYFELPPYSVLLKMINQARDTFERQLQEKLSEQLTREHNGQLDALFEQYLLETSVAHPNAPFQLFPFGR